MWNGAGNIMCIIQLEPSLSSDCHHSHPGLSCLCLIPIVAFETTFNLRIRLVICRFFGWRTSSGYLSLIWMKNFAWLINCDSLGWKNSPAFVIWAKNLACVSITPLGERPGLYNMSVTPLGERSGLYNICLSLLWATDLACIIYVCHAFGWKTWPV